MIFAMFLKTPCNTFGQHLLMWALSNERRRLLGHSTHATAITIGWINTCIRSQCYNVEGEFYI